MYELKNSFMVSEVDLHEMNLEQARRHLDKFIKEVSPDVKEIAVIHGYNKGKTLLEMVRKRYKNKRVKSKYIGLNNGVTYFILQ